MDVVELPAQGDDVLAGFDAGALFDMRHAGVLLEKIGRELNLLWRGARNKDVELAIGGFEIWRKRVAQVGIVDVRIGANFSIGVVDDSAGTLPCGGGTKSHGDLPVGDLHFNLVGAGFDKIGDVEIVTAVRAESSSLVAVDPQDSIASDAFKTQDDALACGDCREIYGPD